MLAAIFDGLPPDFNPLDCGGSPLSVSVDFDCAACQGHFPSVSSRWDQLAKAMLAQS
jgi:CRP/FNR family transcriptional regulator, cyclic AMP receptor protein